MQAATDLRFRPRYWAWRLRRTLLNGMRRQSALGHLPRGWGWTGALWQPSPARRHFGVGAGRCVDRYYIERFLAEYADDIRGRVLEIGDAEYTRRFGGARVIRSDVLHRVTGHPQATIVGDLTQPGCLPASAFDCIIFTQTLQFIYDARAALSTLHDSLRPGGVLLATVPFISQVSRFDAEQWGDYWRFTPEAARTLFAEVFGTAAVTVEAYGNVLAATALLHGIVVEELRPSDLDANDPDYTLIVAVRATRSPLRTS